MTDILSIGTSAGGARAKAVIAWNPQTNEVRSGQVNAGEEALNTGYLSLMVSRVTAIKNWMMRKAMALLNMPVT